MKKSIIAAAAALTLMTSAALADHEVMAYVDTEMLSNDCLQEEPNWNEGFCSGYIIGIADIMATHTVNGWSACVSTDATIGHLRQIVSVWLKSNQGVTGYSGSATVYNARGIVAEAISSAYPC